jgi:uncharacterized membrane protein YkvI
MKVVAGVMIVLAIVLAIVPMFTDCESQGNQMTMASGMKMPMKCHWTGLAELALAVPLLVVGSLMAVSNRRESQRNAGLIAAALGLFVTLLPTKLIGVCANPDMICNSTMKPTLILLGTLIMVGGLVIAFQAMRNKEETA